MLTLAVQARDAKESAEALRVRGLVPAVFYGPKEASTAIAIDERALARAWKEAGETTIIALTGVGEQKETLIRDTQSDPISGRLMHADFYVLEKGKKISISIPLHFEGVAPAEKAGAVIVKTLHEVEIEVSPAELPQHLTIDLSKLVNVGDHMLVSDIPLPASASLVTDAEEVVVSATAFQEEKETVATAPSEVVITTGAAAAEAAKTEEKAQKGE